MITATFMDHFLGMSHHAIIAKNVVQSVIVSRTALVDQITV